MPVTTSEQSSNKQSGGTKNVVAVVVTIIILCVIGFLVWWFGWHNSSSPSTNPGVVNNSQTTPPTTAQKEQAIKTNWVKFFNGATPANEKASLLQNGQQFAPVIQQMYQTKTAKATTVTVSKVKLNSGTTATVTYTINVDQHPTLKDQTGQAVLVNGTWKVGDQAFCNLIKMSGTVPPMCPGGQQSSKTPQTQTNQPSQTTNPTTTQSNKQ